MRVIKVACGGFHTLALTSDNDLYGFGGGCYGELGQGVFADSATPKQIIVPGDTQKQEDEDFELDLYLQEAPVIKSIAAGGHHSMILTSKGKVFMFGFGSHGQLGLKTTSNVCRPTLVKDFSGKVITSIAAGWNHSLALTQLGDLYVCGNGVYGQLGLGDK